jgi:hypothetical protein
MGKVSGKTVTTATITGTRTTINVGDSWNQTISQKIESNGTHDNIPYNSTYYYNYTEKYAVIYDSKSVTVPAGTFNCYVINISMNVTGGYVFYYISNKWPIKTEYYYLNYTTGLFEVYSVTELVSYSSATSTTPTTATKGFIPGFELAFLMLACITATFLGRCSRR